MLILTFAQLSIHVNQNKAQNIESIKRQSGFKLGTQNIPKINF